MVHFNGSCDGTASCAPQPKKLPHTAATWQHLGPYCYYKVTGAQSHIRIFFLCTKTIFLKVLMCWQCLKTNQQTKRFHEKTRFPSSPEEVRNRAWACYPGTHGLAPSAPRAHCTLCAPIQALWASRFQPRLYRALRTSPALPCSEWAGGVRALHPFPHQTGLHSCTHPVKQASGWSRPVPWLPVFYCVAENERSSSSL